MLKLLIELVALLVDLKQRGLGIDDLGFQGFSVYGFSL